MLLHGAEAMCGSGGSVTATDWARGVGCSVQTSVVVPWRAGECLVRLRHVSTPEAGRERHRAAACAVEGELRWFSRGSSALSGCTVAALEHRGMDWEFTALLQPKSSPLQARCSGRSVAPGLMGQDSRLVSSPSWP